MTTMLFFTSSGSILIIITLALVSLFSPGAGDDDCNPSANVQCSEVSNEPDGSCRYSGLYIPCTYYTLLLVARVTYMQSSDSPHQQTFIRAWMILRYLVFCPPARA